MNDEFQWRSQMRRLNTPEQPEHDLWPELSARIAQQPKLAPRRNWRRGFVAIAAALVVASGAGLLAYRLDPKVAPPAPAPAPEIGAMQNAAPAPRTALDWAVPADPRLVAAAQDLDKASADLQAALEARPDAVFLVSMINRTNAQRMRLLRQSAISG